jgi:hypothetical protein
MEAWSSRFSRLMAETAAAELGPTTTYNPVTGVLCTPSGALVSCRDLRRRLALVAADCWEAEITAFVGAARRAAGEVGARSIRSWVELGPRLGLRLEVRPTSAVGVRLSPGLKLVVIAALDHATMPVLPHHCRGWGRSRAQVAARARRNTVAGAASVVRYRWPSPWAAPVELTILSGGPFTTGLAVDLDRHVPGTGTGLLLAPDDHTLLVVSLTAPVSAIDFQEAAKLLRALAAAAVDLELRPAGTTNSSLIRFRPGRELAIFASTADPEMTDKP